MRNGSAYDPLRKRPESVEQAKKWKLHQKLMAKLKKKKRKKR